MFEEEEFIIAQNGSPSAVGPVCISHLFVSGLVCLDTVSSVCSEFDRSPAFLRSRRRVSWTSNRCERNHYSRLHLQAAGRGDPPAPWPRTGEGGEYHQHPPSVEGWLVDKGINWLHHGRVPVLGHYIAVSDTAALLGRGLLPDSNLF